MRLQRLIEELRVLTAGTDDPDLFEALRSLRSLVDGFEDSAALDLLSNDELRAFKGFQVTLAQAEKMEPDAARLHVSAHYLGAVDQALRKLCGGPEAARLMSVLAARPGPGGLGT
jgi:uncharacterized protein YigA (DUF484 family)